LVSLLSRSHKRQNAAEETRYANCTSQDVGYSYRDLLVWQKAKLLTVGIYRNTEQFPRSEIYGLTAQLRRTAVSWSPTLQKARAG